MFVIRPSDPTIPIALAQKALADNDPVALERVIQDAEAQGVEYTFVGAMAKGTPVRILNEHGREVDLPRMGDSYVSIVPENAEKAKRTWRSKVRAFLGLK